MPVGIDQAYSPPCEPNLSLHDEGCTVQPLITASGPRASVSTQYPRLPPHAIFRHR